MPTLSSKSATTVRGTDDTEPKDQSPNLRLEVVHCPAPDALGAVGHLEQGRATLIGRDVSEGLSLGDPRLSRLHLRIDWDNGKGCFVYRDAGSANGTFANGKRSQSGMLLAGDVLRIGDTLLVAVDSDPSAMLRERAQRAARSPLQLLIRGETGSGKELLASLIHAESGRSGPFLAVNCAAMPRDLAAAELFGHTRGAFSGAGAGRQGLFRAAEGGTLLLDEIGDLPLELQGHLLRVLQEGSVRPLGSDRELPIDVRVIAATHVDLEQAAQEGRFRGDLLARLAQLILVVPPLRLRRGEILTLAKQFAPDLAFSANAAEALLLWDWPYNVRELKSLLTAHAALSPADALVRARDLIERLPTAERVLARELAPEPRNVTAVDQRKKLADLLSKHDGNVTRVARELGKPRAQIYRWLRAFGLSRADKR